MKSIDRISYVSLAEDFDIFKFSDGSEHVSLKEDKDIPAGTNVIVIEVDLPCELYSSGLLMSIIGQANDIIRYLGEQECLYERSKKTDHISMKGRLIG